VGIRIFDLFCSCDFDLDPITFIHELDLYFLKTEQGSSPIKHITGCIGDEFLVEWVKMT